MSRKYRFITTVVKGDPETVVIKLKKLRTGEEMIHPISIVADALPGRKAQTVYSFVSHFTRFLNFIYFDSSFTVSSISDINKNIVGFYFEELSHTSGRNNVKAAESAITRCLYYLYKRGYLPLFAEDDFSFTGKNKSKTPVISSLHSNYSPPQATRTNRLHDLKPEMVNAILNIAAKLDPTIALAIYLQLFGGLRCSEVLTLEFDDLHYNPASESDQLYVDIKNKDLRPDLKTGFIAKAKRPRKQIVFVFNSLYSKLYDGMIKNRPKSDSNALFLNTKGQPMTVQVYRYRLNKIKSEVIAQLKASDDLNTQLYGTYLESHNWSTHVFRGFFSNMVASKSRNSYEVATLRGDKSYDSALPYLSGTERVKNAVNSALEELYGDD